MSHSHIHRGDTFLARGHSSKYPIQMEQDGPNIENKVTKAIREILEKQELLSQLTADEVGLEGVAYNLPDGNGAGFYFESVYMPIELAAKYRQQTKGEILTCRDVALVTPIRYGAFLKAKGIDGAAVIRFDEQGELTRGFYNEPHFEIHNLVRIKISFKGLGTYEGDDFCPVFNRMVQIYKKLTQGSQKGIFK